MMNYLRACMLLVCCGLVAPGCGADVGESCETRGSLDECVEGAICADLSPSGSEFFFCKRICVNDAQCFSGDVCSFIPGVGVKTCNQKLL